MRALTFLLAAAAITATPAYAEVTAKADNGFVVKHVVSVSTDPDATFAMLRTPAKWWDKDHSWTGNSENLYMDAQAGGCFCELIPNEATTESGAPQRTLRGSVQHMQIVYVDPGNMLRLSGALGPLQAEAVTGTMTISLTPIKGGTRLAFEYVVGGFMRMSVNEIAPGVDAVIGAQASRLAMALGPLVGGSNALAEPLPVTGAESQEPVDSPANENSVSDLVTDLAPDDSVSDGPAVTSPPAANAAPASSTAPKRYKPGTRPITRPARDKDERESGR